jgi:hypothetical protein
MSMVWFGFLTARQFAFGRFRLQGETLDQQMRREQADREKAELAGTIPVGSLPTEEHSELDLD